MKIEIIKQRAVDGNLSYFDIVEFYELTGNSNFKEDLKKVKERYAMCGPECHQRCSEAQCIINWGTWVVLNNEQNLEICK